MGAMFGTSPPLGDSHETTRKASHKNHWRLTQVLVHWGEGGGGRIHPLHNLQVFVVFKKLLFPSYEILVGETVKVSLFHGL